MLVLFEHEISSHLYHHEQWHQDHQDHLHDCQDDHLPPAKHIISSLAHAAPGLSVPWLPSPGGEVDDDVEVDDDEEVDDDGVDDDVPEKLVVDDDGVDEVESKEPEEETRDPAGKLIMVVIVLIVLMNMLTCNSSREVAV